MKNRLQTAIDKAKTAFYKDSLSENERKQQVLLFHTLEHLVADEAETDSEPNEAQ
jgi:hypothetical protein